MKINKIALLCVSVLLFACGNTKNAPVEITDTYYGILPCADCPGIYYALELNEDFTYSEKSLYLESEADTATVKGIFQIKDDSLIVLSSNSGKNWFDLLKISNGTLKALDKDGKEITSELAELYVLTTTKPVDQEAQTNQQINEKPNFKATGNEPFWALKIDSESKHMTFSPLDGKKITTTLPKKIPKENGWEYTATSESGMLKVLILKEKCQDDMSGKFFSHKVSVSFKTPEMKETKTYSGCGTYVQKASVPTTLEGTWVLKKMNNKIIATGSFQKKPTMTINSSEGKLMGNGGCNQYSGSINAVGDNKISVSKIRSTKMACPHLDIEGEFFKAISIDALSYKLKEGKLIFQNAETTLVFEKIE